MKLVALMPARNEEWVLGLSLRVALMWCDAVIVLDHASTDRTPEILDEISRETELGRVNVLHEPDALWSEMAHRQRLLDAARAIGATHCALVDADEILTGNLLPGIRERIGRLRPGEYATTRMLAMWRGIEAYRHDSSVWSNRTDLVLAFADGRNLIWQQQTGGYDHHHRHPMGSRPSVMWPDGGVMHLQFASWRRLRAKHALYKMSERLRWPNKPVQEIDRLYSLALDESALRVQAVPDAWWDPYRHLLPHLQLAHEPWQEAECQRLKEAHSPRVWRGLNLFGVV